MAQYLTIEGDTYETARERFTWDVPEEYNIARDCLRKHDPESIALFQGLPDGRIDRYTFGDLDQSSDRLASGLTSIGVDKGDRVAVVGEQRVETLLAHFAAWKAGAVSVPLSVLFGTSALEHRLGDSGARVVFAETSALDRVLTVANECSNLETVVVLGGTKLASETNNAVDEASDRLVEASLGVRSFDELLVPGERKYEIAQTDPSDPALVIYTSGTTGPAKGVLHTHEVCLGYCPAFSMYFEQPDGPSRGVYWTPSDWAWMGGIGTIVLPAWHYGLPVVGRPTKSFTAETAYDIMETFGVTHASLPPTALRRLRDAEVRPDNYDLSLEVIVSGSEPLTPEIVTWVEETFESVVINEGYGQTEIGNVVTNCQCWFDLRSGSMGKAVPGYEVAVVDPESGERLPPGETGEIVIRRAGNPGVFERYLNDPEAEIGRDGWYHTGDLAYRDEDGYLWFVARSDDLILASGYRIAPQAVERVLLEHEDIAAAGVVGRPDDDRGEAVAAFVSLRSGVTSSEEIREALRERVRTELARYAYPRTIAVVDEVPTTRTGKVDRETLSELIESQNGEHERL